MRAFSAAGAHMRERACASLRETQPLAARGGGARWLAQIIPA